MGCQKDRIQLEYEVINLPVHSEVRCIFPLGDSLILAGGDVDQNGFVLKGSVDNGQFVVVKNDFRRELYAISYHQNQWYAAADSILLYRGSKLQTLSEYYWNEADWVSDLSKHPIRQIAEDSTGILMVAGAKLAFGVVYQSYDQGRSWSPLEPENELRCATIKNGRAWVAGNGLLMRSAWGTAEWEVLRLEDRFITDLHFLNEKEGWALTVDGSLLETEDGGEHWEERHTGRNSFMHGLDVSSNLVIAVGEGGSVVYRNAKGFRSTRLDGVDALNDVQIIGGNAFIATDQGSLLKVSLEALRG